jgi:hypothetical protein
LGIRKFYIKFNSSPNSAENLFSGNSRNFEDKFGNCKNFAPKIGNLRK